jgi:hypothetical protein
MVRISFNTGALERVIEEAGRKYAADLQSRLDRLSRELKGKSLEVAKSRVRREMPDRSTLSDAQIAEYATELIAGRRVRVDIKL